MQESESCFAAAAMHCTEYLQLAEEFRILPNSCRYLDIFFRDPVDAYSLVRKTHQGACFCCSSRNPRRQRPNRGRASGTSAAAEPPARAMPSAGGLPSDKHVLHRLNAAQYKQTREPGPTFAGAPGLLHGNRKAEWATKPSCVHG